MKFEIKNRWSGEVQFSCELEAKFEAESYSVQMGAAVKIAVKARANLARANLAGANLEGANLADAYLADAYLADAYLEGANLARAYLEGANLARANLEGALTTPASPEEIARLDQVREIVLKKPERLCMSDWHSSQWDPSHTPEEEHECGSAHCIAGWLQALSPDKEVRNMHPEAAGKTLCPAFSFMFYTSDAVALQWLKDRGYARSPEAAA